MKRDRLIGESLSIGGKCSVGVYAEPVGGEMVFLRFTTSIEKTDFADGELKPRATAQRFKSTLLTDIELPKELCLKLRQILNNPKILKELNRK